MSGAPETNADNIPEIEVTPAMVKAGLDVLRSEPFIDLPLGVAENLIREVIVRTWKLHWCEKFPVR
jgi:hypothetical protein